MRNLFIVLIIVVSIIATFLVDEILLPSWAGGYLIVIIPIAISYFLVYICRTIPDLNNSQKFTKLGWKILLSGLVFYIISLILIYSSPSNLTAFLWVTISGTIGFLSYISLLIGMILIVVAQLKKRGEYIKNQNYKIKNV